MPSMIFNIDPLIRRCVASERSGVQELSYSPESKYTGHFEVSIRCDRSSK